ncbi:MAG: TonB family protein [Nevskiaceae bacterium]|nr:MAG: TonB family protein [Nevskiaceae bacterium]TBR71940.1 MAG: TonB family protein [Nevskiaceae bacterium]
MTTPVTTAAPIWREPSRVAAVGRWSLAAAGAVLLSWLLFSLVQQLIVAPALPPPSDTQVIKNVKVVTATPTPQQPRLVLPPMLSPAAKALPHPAPAGPAPGVPALPALAMPAPATPALDVAAVGVPVDVGTSADLFGSGAFAGFAGGGAGGGGSGGGGGGGAGGSGLGGAADFSGKELIPLSTARPEISKWAYDHKIEGWVEVAFTVMKNGHVSNVRIINAQPKGVFEVAAVKSVAHWIYASRREPVEVKQRVEFKLSDYQYNWSTD